MARRILIERVDSTVSAHKATSTVMSDIAYWVRSWF